VANLASYSMGKVGKVGKDVGTRGAVPPFSQYVFVAWYLVKHRDNFTFNFTDLFTLCRDIFLCNFFFFFRNTGETYNGNTENMNCFRFQTGFHIGNYFQARFITEFTILAIKNQIYIRYLCYICTLHCY
jgi:hypothetical protein